MSGLARAVPPFARKDKRVNGKTVVGLTHRWTASGLTLCGRRLPGLVAYTQEPGARPCAPCERAHRTGTSQPYRRGR